MLGRFHEISIETADIRASVEFYERLGFTHAPTNDTWAHPYGVLTDGRVFIGLHQRRAPSPALTFVRAGVVQHAASIESRGIELDLLRAGDEAFNEFAFSDPNGQRIAVLEARTYSPVSRVSSQTSLCGYFSEYSMPVVDFEATKAFWEPLGFVATFAADEPYPHLPLTSDYLDLAFHQPRTLDRPMLVFREPSMRERITKLRALDIAPSRDLPRTLDATAHALIQAPEGTALLLLSES